jgi:dienelactone hydrolase
MAVGQETDLDIYNIDTVESGNVTTNLGHASKYESIMIKKTLGCFGIATFAVLIYGLAICEAQVQDKKQDKVVWPSNANSEQDFLTWQKQIREKLSRLLGIPLQRVSLMSEKRGESKRDGIVIERWVFISEKGSCVPAVLFRPKTAQKKMPAIVLTYGHGSSKAAPSYNYAAQLYARLGMAVLAIDPIGEDERSKNGKKLGTREHDHAENDRRARDARRPIMGKLVFDSMRAIDFLLERNDIDSERIGVIGHSLGGAVASWTAALDPRVKMAIVCGWGFDDSLTSYGKSCTRIPNAEMRKICSWSEFATLSAPHCAVFVMNGTADLIIDRAGDHHVWVGTQSVADQANRIFQRFDSKSTMECWLETGGGHRPYFLHRDAVKWVNRHLATLHYDNKKLSELPETNFGLWCDDHSIKLEKLYGTKLHDRGATIVDLHLQPTPRSDLLCLKLSELGSDDFTIDGWLKAVEANKRNDLLN